MKKTTPGKIIDNVKDALAVSANIIDSAEHDVAWLASGLFWFSSLRSSSMNKLKPSTERGDVCVGHRYQTFVY